MLIKHAQVNFPAPKQLAPIYFILGQDHFQLEQVQKTLRETWQKQHAEDLEYKSLSMQTATDWQNLDLETQSYSLFSSMTCLTAYYDKKTLETAGKKWLENYIADINPNILLLFHAPQLTAKQLQFITNHPKITIIQCTAPDKSATLLWIRNQLNLFSVPCDPQVPALIYQYNEGNLLACSQVLMKLDMLQPESITLDDVQEQLSNQCRHILFDLGQTCLNSNSLKALQLLLQAKEEKIEPTLVLWLLTQEVRLLLQLLPVSNQPALFRDMASQLKIWNQRVALYQASIRKYTQAVLIDLLRLCNQLDQAIKTSSHKQQIWQSFDIIALTLCSGQKM